jgi:hypothetical protein
MGSELHCPPHLRLVVALRGLLGLLGEPLPLRDGAVQLRVRVAHLAFAHKQLETLSEARPGAVGLGERRHHFRVVHDERRVDARFLQKVADQLVHEASHGARGAAFHVVFLAYGFQERGHLGVFHQRKLLPRRLTTTQRK